MALTVAENPFRDPSVAGSVAPASAEQSGSAVMETLSVTRDVSLTLGTDSLVVLDERPHAHEEDKSFCGLRFGKQSPTRSIRYHNILWAELLDDGELFIQYARPISKQVVRPTIIGYKLDKPGSAEAKAWKEELVKRAYGGSQLRKRIKVLINPFGGQGTAVNIYNKHMEPILRAAQCELDVEQTTHNGHAVEIAEKLDIEKYDVVACVSGDGIPHEVWNGLANRPDAARALEKIAVAQLPGGSGNAMSLNFNGTVSPSLAALAVVKGLRTPQDLVSVTQGDRRILSFLSQSVGIVAETDLATEHLRWMGSARFTYGFLVRLLKKTVYPADIAVKVEYATKDAIRKVYRAEASKPPRNHDDRPLPAADAGLPTLQYGTINDPLPEDWALVPHDHLGNFYAGKLAWMSPDANFFPAALPSDGCMDLVRIRGDIPRRKALGGLLAVSNNTFFDLPDVDYQKVLAYRIIPKNQKDGYISIDGERVPFEPFQAEVHRGLGTVLSKSGHLYEAVGV
ncbi:sphingoid long chain base kinase-like protein [Sporormia fimetaria CBS 119925]|uniref:Sphingoid long chain base kinase-like protein n=1 Tax=Sporormia fimetaria CBS 119925 TaxID=1340428 RepID=A0A6A6V4K5_9PLEO|nr:sphingoid long chain base kinase-like protein [Sporormia fimetaria CBS 119925]